MLLYALLHLTGYDLGIEDLKQFRKLHSRTPGHPEVGYTPGIETTTGPLGQGLANAVGMALAEKLLAEEFNRPGHKVVDHNTYVFLGDGCLMEGISHEVCSLAGTLKLGKLICLYDDNGISIDGHVEGWFSDDTPGRFAAYGWQVIPAVDGHNVQAVRAAIESAKADPRPTLICCRTVIGYGSPSKAGTHDVHGAPLGKSEIETMRQVLKWSHAPFEIPAEVYHSYDAKPRGQALEQDWNNRFKAYRAEFPGQAAELERRMRHDLPENWREIANNCIALAVAKSGSIATRKSSQDAIGALAPAMPELFGGSADLTGSNLTDWKGAIRVNDTGSGRYISYGVREFGMAAMMNGMALHGGFIPFGGTFLVFSDYARNAIRMSALMKQQVIYVLTHDSIGLGEDGPTHQPVEHAASLRLFPGLNVWRPCDAVETAVAWTQSVETRDAPSALLLSRQGLPCLPRDDAQMAAIAKGGYVISAQANPKAMLIATGSEVQLALDTQTLLLEKGIATSVVSMPCMEAYLAQPQPYRESVLPPGIPRLAMEAGHPDPWWKIVGGGDVAGMLSFGESGPAADLFKHFKFTPQDMAGRVIKLTAS
jgi:transketolase